MAVAVVIYESRQTARMSQFRNAPFQVEDKNAAPGYENQTDTAEATFYIQAYKADSPQFSAPWTPGDPTLTFDVKEEQPVGTVLFKLNAKDPVTGQGRRIRSVLSSRLCHSHFLIECLMKDTYGERNYRQKPMTFCIEILVNISNSKHFA